MRKASSYRIHLIASIFTFFLSLIILDFLNHESNIFYLAFVCLIYSLLPDIDTRKSVVWKLITSLFVIFGIIFFSYIFAFLLLIALILISLLKHRGFTHTILSALILSLPLLYIDYGLFIAGLLSYVSHLILDNHIKFM